MIYRFYGLCFYRVSFDWLNVITIAIYKLLLLIIIIMLLC
jgi:hypothetical protein